MFLFIQKNFGQLRINSNASTSNLSSSTAFIDASSSPTWKNSTNEGKGFLFPRVDLSLLKQMVQVGGNSNTNNPNRFDGMLVYNTVTGVSGIGSIQVKPGFYYYSNSSTDNNGGIWIPVGIKDEVVSPSVAVATTSYTILDTDSTILCNADLGGFTVKLPSAADHKGKTYTIRKMDSGSNVLTFDPPIKIVEGFFASSLNYPKTIRLQSDGASWIIID